METRTGASRDPVESRHILLYSILVGFGRACAPVRCAHPSFWAHYHAKRGAARSPRPSQLSIGHPTELHWILLSYAAHCPYVRSIERKLQTQFSMARGRRFPLRPLRRYSINMYPTLPKFTLPPHRKLRIYHVFLNKRNFLREPRIILWKL